MDIRPAMRSPRPHLRLLSARRLGETGIKAGLNFLSFYRTACRREAREQKWRFVRFLNIPQSAKRRKSGETYGHLAGHLS